MTFFPKPLAPKLDNLKTFSCLAFTVKTLERFKYSRGRVSLSYFFIDDVALITAPATLVLLNIFLTSKPKLSIKLVFSLKLKGYLIYLYKYLIDKTNIKNPTKIIIWLYMHLDTKSLVYSSNQSLKKMVGPYLLLLERKKK